MRKYFLLLLMVLIPINVYAERGCCSRHGGVCGCTKYGSQLCCDESGSPTCTCTPPTVYGCTDYNANNYNREANTDDGSCTYTVKGCTDVNARNYNSGANTDDGSCTYDVLGCTDSKAKNYNYKANKDDGSCEYDVEGCTDKNALNYNASATKDDNSCKYETQTKEIGNNNLSSNNESNEDYDGGTAFVGLLTLLSSAGAIVYAKKKRK